VAHERLRILAVEDEAMIALELEDMLEDLGHEVIGPAAYVDDALALLRDAAPDAAVVDANLGGQSARPLIHALRDAGVPTIVASGYARQELRALDIECAYVKKPYSAKDLAAALRKALEQPHH
jgi:DNA-binding response OmpR family regulator